MLNQLILSFVSLSLAQIVIPITRIGYTPDQVERRDFGVNALTSNNAKLFYAFLGSISFGTPAQTFTVMFDKGSFKSWIRSSKCRGLYCGAGYNFFTGSMSSTYKDLNIAAAPITYADGSSLNGTICQDTVSLGGFSLANFQFQEATSLSEASLDGLIGMGQVNTVGYGDLLMAKMVTSSTPSMTSSVFSYWISSNNINGQLVIGGVDTNKFSGNLTWSTTTGTPYWALKLGAIAVGSLNLTISTTYQVVLDTGTSLSYFPLTLAAELNAKLGGIKSSALSSTGLDVYAISCSATTTFTITMGSNNYFSHQQCIQFQLNIELLFHYFT